MNEPTATTENEPFVEGLVTYWYLARRCDDECYRAARYRRPLTLLVVRVPEGPEMAQTEKELRNWMRSNVRLSDIAAYLGERVYGLLLPETDIEGAKGLERRLRVAFPKAQTTVSEHPDHGRNLETLLSSALAVLDKAA